MVVVVFSLVGLRPQTKVEDTVRASSLVTPIGPPKMQARKASGLAAGARRASGADNGQRARFVPFDYLII